MFEVYPVLYNDYIMSSQLSRLAAYCAYIFSNIISDYSQSVIQQCTHYSTIKLNDLLIAGQPIIVPVIFSSTSLIILKSYRFI